MQHAAVRLRGPKITYVPSKGLTNRAENSRNCLCPAVSTCNGLCESGSFRKNPRYGKIDRSSLFLALSIGNLCIRFQDRSRPSFRIAVERPTANDDNFRAVFAGMRKFATPSVLALEFFANIGERL